MIIQLQLSTFIKTQANKTSF